MKQFLSILCAIVFLVLAGAGCVPAPAPCTDTLTVTTNIDSNDGACTAGHCSLREAVIAANACAGLQTIVIPPANYQLTLLGSDEDASATGDLDIIDDLIIHGVGVPSLDGISQDRILEIFNSAVVEIDQIIFMNGLAQLGGAIRSHGTLKLTGCSIHNNVADVPPGGSGASSGGGIFVEAGTTTLVGTDVMENYADFGGGIHNFATASFYMSGGHLIGNIASGWGGGLWNNMASDSTLENVEVERNSAAERGAGIYNNGTLETNFVTFTENIDADEGGGLYNDDNGVTTLNTSWFTNNVALVGGAVFNVGVLDLIQNSFTNNSAMGGLGGAIYNDSAPASLLLSNSTVSGNMISPLGFPGGGGIYNNGGSLNVEFSTFAYNNADGISNNGGSVSLRSSILAYHSLGNCTGVMGGSLGHNLEDQDTCNLTEPSDMIDTNPFLLWLEMPAAPGYVGLFHPLDPGSPAIDTGDTDHCVAMDQRGVARPQGVGCDIGAVEMETEEATPASSPMADALSNAHCRRGPDTAYDSFAMLETGQSYEIIGRTQMNDWWRIMMENGVMCWVSDTQVEVTGETSGVAIVDVPPADITLTPAVGCYIQKRCVVPCPPDTQNEGPCVP